MSGSKQQSGDAFHDAGEWIKATGEPLVNTGEQLVNKGFSENPELAVTNSSGKTS